jgi:hypothetical protein
MVVLHEKKHQHRRCHVSEALTWGRWGFMPFEKRLIARTRQLRRHPAG